MASTLPDYAKAFPHKLTRLWTFGDPPVYTLPGNLEVAAVQIPPGGIVHYGEDSPIIDWASIPASGYVVSNSGHQHYGDVQALYDAQGNLVRYAKINNEMQAADYLEAIETVGAFYLGVNALLPVNTGGGSVMGDWLDFGSFSLGAFTGASFSDAGVGNITDSGAGDWGPSIDYGDPSGGSFDVPGSGSVDMGTPDFSTAQAALDNWNSQLDPAWNAQTGAVTADQFGSLSGVQNQAVKQAAKQVLSQVQGSQKSATPNASQIQAARNAALQQAASSTDPSTKQLWNTAAGFLGAFGGYQGTATGPATGNAWQSPASTPNAVVRQPDGSISIRNADGTITTIGANGAVKTSPFGSTIHALTSGNTPLIIGAVGLVAAVAFMRSRH